MKEASLCLLWKDLPTMEGCPSVEQGCFWRWWAPLAESLLVEEAGGILLALAGYLGPPEAVSMTPSLKGLLDMTHSPECLELAEVSFLGTQGSSFGEDLLK